MNAGLAEADAGLVHSPPFALYAAGWWFKSINRHGFVSPFRPPRGPQEVRHDLARWSERPV